MLYQALLIALAILSFSPMIAGGESRQDQEVSPTLVNRFNLAAQLGREGKSEESLKALENLFAPFDDPAEPMNFSTEFKAEVYLRTAYAYMDMKRYDEARKVFEKQDTLDLLPKLPPDRVHSYHFAYGNTLGALGEMNSMLKHMTKALELAPEEGALTDAKTCWVRMMDMLRDAKEWQKLEDICLKAYAYSGKHENYALRFQAGEYAFFAYVGQKKYDKARTRGKAVLAWYQDSMNNPESKDWAQQKAAEWQQYLKDLPE